MEFAHNVLMNVHSLPRKGQEVRLASNADQLAALAKNHALVAVLHFEACLFLTPRSGGRVHLRGLFSATVVQNCVVSGEPVTGDVHDTFTVLFMPQADLGENKGTMQREIIVDMQELEEDEQEFFDGNEIHLGAILEEFFELALDPYPRKPGVEFQPIRLGTEEIEIQGQGRRSPFAALKKLAQS